MTRNNEKLLIAMLAGIIIAGAAAFAVQPSLASTADPKMTPGLASTSYDVLLLQLDRKS